MRYETAGWGDFRYHFGILTFWGEWGAADSLNFLRRNAIDNHRIAVFFVGVICVRMM